MPRPPTPSSYAIALAFAILLALSVRFDPARAATPRQTGTPDASVSACAVTFPIEERRLFLPLAFNGGATGEETGATLPVTLKKEAGRLAPIGDQLGDVGQYYSQVAPSLRSHITIRNPGDAGHTFTLALFGDNGFKARTLSRCQIDAGASLSAAVEGGELTLRQNGQRLDLNATCQQVVVHKTNGNPTEPTLHGLYQAQIESDDGRPLTVRVESAVDAGHPQTAYLAADEAPAVAETQAGARVHLPGVVATRERDNWWDTEIVVQNVGEQAASVQITFCSADGACFQNNRATLQTRERRIFLASHLLYADNDGFLEDRSGWYAATVSATSAEGGDRPARIIAAVNFFQQPVKEDDLWPRAEQGGTCLQETGQPLSATQLTFPLDRGAPPMLRIQNAEAGPNRLELVLLDVNDAEIGRITHEVASGSTWSLRADEFARLPLEPATTPGTLPGTIPGTIPGDIPVVEPDVEDLTALRVVSERPVSALVWDGEQLVEPLEQDAPAPVWYAPLVGAPVVPFRWDDGGADDPARVGRPGAGYGLAETGVHSQRPEWAREMNWYVWHSDRRYCSQPVSEDKPYSTYIPLVRGLLNCDGNTGRDCVNTDERLARVRNIVPSACAGRPLFLINEPDLRSQTYMTYHELGRAIYLLREWPGQLFSPVFASQYYDRPTYPAESDPWCRIPENLASCPDGLYCERCIQDGIEDGETDPYDISFAGLEAYFGEMGRWARGQAWRFDQVVEGMLLHVYLPVNSFTEEALGGAPHYRAALLRQFRDRADEAGWPIIVKEYGFVTWPDVDGNRPDVDPMILAARVDDLRRLLQENLGGGAPKHGGNPQKLFWFHTGCGDSPYLEVYKPLCLFDDVTGGQFTRPLGACWQADAVAELEEDTTCGVVNGWSYLPFVGR